MSHVSATARGTRCAMQVPHRDAGFAPPRVRGGRCRIAPHAMAGAAELPAHITRRAFFGVGVALGGGLLASRANAAAPAPPVEAPGGAPYKTFLGYNVQPDLYLGQGYKLAMNYEGRPAYSFEYPAAFEAVPVSKTDKSTMGMDGMVSDPKSRTQAFVVALGGKDYAEARLTDTTSALRAMAGGDPDLREAVSNASAVTATVKKINGVETYCYEIEGDKAHYLAKVAIKDGTVFGLFASAPLAKWELNEAGLRRIYDTFTLL